MPLHRGLSLAAGFQKRERRTSQHIRRGQREIRKKINDDLGNKSLNQKADTIGYAVHGESPSVKPGFPYMLCGVQSVPLGTRHPLKDKVLQW